MKKFFSLGLIKGLLYQFVGTAVGFALVTLIQTIEGKPLNAEPAWVVGGAIGALSFMWGVGAFRDWWLQVQGKPAPEPHEVEDLAGARRFFGVSYDHKVIGVQYGITSLFLLALGGTFALIFRTELAAPGLQVLNYIQFNTLIGMHGIVLIVSILLGTAGIGNYVVPLLIGAKDMAFPRLNAFAFWLAVPAAVLLVLSMPLGGFETGWTGYPPLSVRGPMGIQMFFIGVFFAGWSSILGALNLVVTVVRERTPGMNYFRMPIFAWAAFATSLIAMTATQLIGLSFQLVLFERLLGMPFFDPTKGGNPILFQHLFWFYSHPAVYIFVLPGLGIISEILPVFVRKPLFGYRWVAMSSMGIALTGFLVWGHHMFTAGIEDYLRVPFMYTTLLVAVPTGVKFFSWVATIWQGRLTFPTTMLFVIGGIVVFLLGGLTGPPLATVSTDLHLQDTYFVVGHFHDTMFGGYIFPLFAAIYFWFPKITGRRMSETLGKVHFWLMTPAFLLMTLSQMQVGLIGMRRRIADYDPSQGLQGGNILVTIGGFLIAFSVLVFFFNLIRSIGKGELATGNLWESRSPEWQVPSPAPTHNYANGITVVGNPYDYGLEGSRYVEIPSELPEELPERLPASEPDVVRG
jgi:cytochrome c oxidase subunit 1